MATERDEPAGSGPGGYGWRRRYTAPTTLAIARGVSARSTDPARGAAAPLGRTATGGPVNGEAKDLRELARRIEEVTQQSKASSMVWEQVQALLDYITL